mmetsp:Transcript_104729/g.337669  ORF Transcript_104729/g.337669 Transcript_104729/m.337669 type:complete len:343 (+) Transcript_104729:82-1110(+)
MAPPSGHRVARVTTIAATAAVAYLSCGRRLGSSAVPSALRTTWVGPAVALRSNRRSTLRAAAPSATPEADPATEPADPADARPVVAVVGAGGRTGALVVDALLKAGARPRALTRTGQWSSPSKAQEEVEVGQADVTDAASLAAAVAGASAVVFAAAFSRGKSLPKDVDNAGLVRTARAAQEQGVGRLVVVSSAATTRPYAPVGVLLNTVGSGVLLEKLKGESEMRGILRGTGTTYTIIRPGGLKTGEASGFSALEFNQGDTHVGSVQRADVAAVCAAVATDPENRGAGKTFEMYEAQSRNGLLPWYGEPKYAVAGRGDCGEMLGALLDDEEVTDVPGFLPFS